METINQLKSKGYTVREDNNRYLQKKLKWGWYVNVDVVRNEVTATNFRAYLKKRSNHMAYDYELTDHTNLTTKAGLKVNKQYVRNEEAKRVPSHMLVGWAELLEHRLK